MNVRILYAKKIQKVCQIRRQIECQRKCQIICQTECKVECQNICHIYVQMTCQKLCRKSEWGSIEESTWITWVFFCQLPNLFPRKIPNRPNMFLFFAPFSPIFPQQTSLTSLPRPEWVATKPCSMGRQRLVSQSDFQALEQTRSLAVSYRPAGGH